MRNNDGNKIIETPKTIRDEIVKNFGIFISNKNKINIETININIAALIKAVISDSRENSTLGLYPL